MCLFIGLDASSAELELPSSNRWVVPSWAHDANVADSRVGGAAAPLSAVFIEFPSSKDDRWEERANPRPLWKALDESGADSYKRAGACCQVLAPCDYEWFARFDARAQAGVSEDANGAEGKPVRASARLHREEYGAMKAELTERLLAITLEQFPSMAGHVVHTELGTPLSMNTYLGSTRGELYGLAHGASRFSGRFQRLLRPETPIRGLYLTGQDVLLQGLWGAMMSGVLTVIAVATVLRAKRAFLPAPDTASHLRLSAQLAFLSSARSRARHVRLALSPTEVAAEFERAPLPLRAHCAAGIFAGFDLRSVFHSRPEFRAVTLNGASSAPSVREPADLREPAPRIRANSATACATWRRP